MLFDVPQQFIGAYAHAHVDVSELIEAALRARDDDSTRVCADLWASGHGEATVRLARRCAENGDGDGDGDGDGRGSRTVFAVASDAARLSATLSLCTVAGTVSTVRPVNASPMDWLGWRAMTDSDGAVGRKFDVVFLDDDPATAKDLVKFCVSRDLLTSDALLLFAGAPDDTSSFEAFAASHINLDAKAHADTAGVPLLCVATYRGKRSDAYY